MPLLKLIVITAKYKEIKMYPNTSSKYYFHNYIINAFRVHKEVFEYILLGYLRRLSLTCVGILETGNVPRDHFPQSLLDETNERV